MKLLLALFSLTRAFTFAQGNYEIQVYPGKTLDARGSDSRKAMTVG